jgi:DNA-binding NarL/FixJ family response regulator
MIRVAVVDDHPHVAIALRALLDETPDIQMVAESRHGGDVAALVRRVRPDVLLLDLFIEPSSTHWRWCVGCAPISPSLRSACSALKALVEELDVQTAVDYGTVVILELPC